MLISLQILFTRNYKVDPVVCIKQYISLLFWLWQNFEKHELYKRCIVVRAIQSKPGVENEFDCSSQ